MSVRVGYILLSLAAAHASTHKIVVDTSRHVSLTDEIYACVNFDLWPSSKCDYGNCPWGESGLFNLPLENKSIVKAMQAFENKVHLRIGGSLQDFVVYNATENLYCTYADFSEPTNTTKIGYEYFSGCLSNQRWDELNSFCNNAGCDIIFGINALYGRTPPDYSLCPSETNCHIAGEDDCCTNWSGGPWDNNNARAFMQYTYDRSYNIYAYQFGNELVGDKGIETHLTVDEYAEDWVLFVDTLNSVYSGQKKVHKPLTVVPDTTFQAEWYGEFLKLLGAGKNAAVYAPDVVSHHLYSMGAGVNSQAWAVALNVTVLDQVVALGKEVRSVVDTTSKGSKIWVGEGGGCYNSGANNVTNAFNSGFWWLDQLGAFARQGHGAYCRQAFIGGYYSLLDPTSFIPNPDYYTLLTWSRIMGAAVLDVSHTTADTNIRSYAHCTSKDSQSYVPGSISVVLINLSNTTTVDVEISGFATSPSDTRKEFIFSSACGADDERTLLACREVLLNGLFVKTGAEGDIPSMEPKITAGMGSTVTMHPLTYGFVVFDHARAPACH